MGRLTTAQQESLSEMFHERFTADLMERRIYGHDVGTMPPLVKPLIGKAEAGGVVQPADEGEVVRLIRWAGEQRVPLTPRGKATSGYGGVLPVKGGVIVDMWRMRQVVKVDSQAQTVTVQPAIVWKELETELHKQGLALRLYPSSAPSSTVGGWLAQGGYGFGSLEYGAFKENVISARVVLPGGQVKDFTGAELAGLVADAEGITGIIVAVTLRVRPLEEEMVYGAHFDTAGALTAALREVLEKKVPLWSASFINPAMATLKNQLPPKMEHGHPAHEQRPEIPAGFSALFVCPASRAGQVQSVLDGIIARHGGRRMSQELAAHEWEGRFHIMAIKRLGPSIIPTELIVPLDRLDAVLNDLDAQIKQPIAMEGMLAGGAAPQVILLGFIPHDERTFAFNLAFGLSLVAIQRAKRLGGRAYASGLYFAHEAESILGKERVQQLRSYKAQVDPAGIMNPGKILGNGLLGTFMRTAGAFTPLVRAVANPAKAPVGERIQGAGKRGIPDDVAWYAYTCAQCGYCVNGCTEFYGRGQESYSPRAKWFFLREYMAGRAQFDQPWVDRFMACTTCERCNVECPLELPIESSWLKMREYLIAEKGKLTLPAFAIMEAALKGQRNIWASYSRNRADWVPEEIRPKIQDKAEVGYFAGCTASFVEKDIAQGAVRLLDAAGIKFTTMGTDENCCGLPMLVSGFWDTFADVVRHNVTKMKERGVHTVVTSCPACWLSWHTYYPEWAKKLGIDYDFEVKHYSEILAERIQAGDFHFTHEVPMKVTWHDSCHIGRAGGVYEPPRQVLEAIPGIDLVEMEYNRENSHCCGSVLTLLENPDTGKAIGDVRLREADATGAQAIAALCPCCEVQLRITKTKTNREIQVVDLANLASQGLGLPTFDPTDFAMEQWATFEAMIWLLKPENMAGLMAELLPQMIEAMPGMFRGMMKMVKKAPKPVREAMIAMMKPMMPPLFPILMPGMMPKVMPDMLTAVGARVPMPDYMQEQMPDLMPAAMDKLLPKMLPLVIPHFMPLMVAYLRGENGSK